MPKKTVDSWTDAFGQTYRPGDLVAVATVNNKSPQMVVAEVVSINATDAKGNPYYTLFKSPAFADDGRYHLGPDAKRTVTVTAVPVHDGRGFGRYGQPNRKVTYSVAGNIIALPGKTRADLAGDAPDGAVGEPTGS